MIRHMRTNIAGLLRYFEGKSLNGMLQDENGRDLSDKEARDFLAEALAKGWKYLPCGDCVGFDHFENGCPGHPSETHSETLNDLK